MLKSVPSSICIILKKKGLKNDYAHHGLFGIHKAPQGNAVPASHKTIRRGGPLPLSSDVA